MEHAFFSKVHAHHGRKHKMSRMHKSLFSPNFCKAQFLF